MPLREASEPETTDVFARLGVRTVINAFETMSSVGGTKIRPEALEAMRRAAGSFVFLNELNAKVGERIAALTRNEGAVVTNGALAGMLLATAACLRRANPDMQRPIALPASWHKDEVIVQRSQYSPYVPGITQVGARIVEIGYTQQTTPEWVFEGAITERTAAIFYTAGRPYERFAVPLDRVIAIARAHDLPVIVDGAALLPPIENLWRFTEAGAALAVFSGGKGLRGPQDSGVVVGLKALTKEIHHMNSPNHGLGRAFKSSKEDVAGFLVALEIALKEDEPATYREYMRRAEMLRDGLSGLENATTYILPEGRQGQPCPRTVVQLAPGCGLARGDVVRELAAGDPAILVGELDEDANAFYLTPRSLSDEEIKLVVREVRACLGRSR